MKPIYLEVPPSREVQIFQKS